MTTILTRTVTVAAGVFAPGHLGELTMYLPFELVDDVLAQTRTVEQRLRALPSRAGVYFVLALALFPQIGYARVWAKLCAGPAGLTGADHLVTRVSAVSEKALRELRRRLGTAPFKALFEVLAGPLARPRTPGMCFAGLRTVAFDGLNSLKVPDTARNRGWLGRIRYRMGFAGYPTVRLMCLVETGTRCLLGAVIGAGSDRDEATLAMRLVPALRPGMLVLLDRGFDTTAFLTAVHRTGAVLLVRARSQRVPLVLAHLPDGSYLSDLDGLAVRGHGAAPGRRRIRCGRPGSRRDGCEGYRGAHHVGGRPGSRHCSRRGDASAVTDAVDQVLTELGAPTVLVNNAGVTRDNLLFKLSEADWASVMSVHLRGAFLMTRSVQKHMVAAGWGRVVNISSLSALGTADRPTTPPRRLACRASPRPWRSNWASSVSPPTRSARASSPT